jgi:hypothetical protein
MASTSTAKPGPGPTEALLLPGSIPLSKEAVVSALAKASVWGIVDKKKGVLLSLTEMRDTLLAKVGEASQGQKTTLEKWIPATEREVRNSRFRASEVAEYLYEISIVFDAYRADSAYHQLRNDPLNDIFTAIDSMMSQARQDAESNLLDHANAARVKLSPRELDRSYLMNGYKPQNPACQRCAFCDHDYVDEPNSNRIALEENRKRIVAHDNAKIDAEAKKARGEQLFGAKGKPISRAPTVPKCLPVYYQCHCFQQHNIRSDGSDQDSTTCQIKCTDPETGKKYPRDKNGMPTCPICSCMCQAAYKVGSHQVILTLRQQGKLVDETGAVVPSAQERERRANFAHALSDVIETSIGVAIQNQLQQQFGSTTNFRAARGPSSTAHQASNVAALPPGFTGVQLDSNRLQEETYMHASRALVGRFKPDISTHANPNPNLAFLAQQQIAAAEREIERDFRFIQTELNDISNEFRERIAMANIIPLTDESRAKLVTLEKRREELRVELKLLRMKKPKVNPVTEEPFASCAPTPQATNATTETMPPATNAMTETMPPATNATKEATP